MQKTMQMAIFSFKINFNQIFWAEIWNQHMAGEDYHALDQYSIHHFLSASNKK